LQIKSFLLTRAVSIKAVDIGDIEVVQLESWGSLGSVVQEVLELGDVVALALLRLGDLDRYTTSILSICGFGVVLPVTLSLFESHHLAGRAALTLEDRPKVDGVVATIDNTRIGFRFVAT
jgi:hypothetical protein